MLTAKEQQRDSAKTSFQELQRGRDAARDNTDAQMTHVTQQLNDIQQKHMAIITRTKSAEKISVENIEKLYSDVGECSMHAID